MLNETTINAQSILRIASIQDVNARREALSDVCDLFEKTPRGRGYEIQSLGETVEKLIDTLHDKDRAFLAARLAAASLAPTYLLRRLALDGVIAVSLPILATSNVLGEEDLLAAAERGGTERLEALAKRDRLTPKLERRLIDANDVLVLRTLYARKDITARKALSDALACFYFDLPKEERETFITAQAKKNLPPPQMPNRTIMIELMKHLRSDKLGLFARTLSEKFSIPQPIVELAVNDDTFEGMALLVHGLGLSRAVYSSFVILTSPTARAHEPVLLANLNLFDNTPTNGAAAIVAAWRNANKATPAASETTTGSPPIPAQKAPPAMEPKPNKS